MLCAGRPPRHRGRGGELHNQLRQIFSGFRSFPLRLDAQPLQPAEWTPGDRTAAGDESLRAWAKGELGRFPSFCRSPKAQREDLGKGGGGRAYRIQKILPLVDRVLIEQGQDRTVRQMEYGRRLVKEFVQAADDLPAYRRPAARTGARGRRGPPR